MCLFVLSCLENECVYLCCIVFCVLCCVVCLSCPPCLVLLFYVDDYRHPIHIISVSMTERQMLAIFTLINLIIYLDRGIIPGAPSEIGMMWILSFYIIKCYLIILYLATIMIALVCIFV
jgi:hypothetical protein